MFLHFFLISLGAFNFHKHLGHTYIHCAISHSVSSVLSFSFQSQQLQVSPGWQCPGNSPTRSPNEFPSRWVVCKHILSRIGCLTQLRKKLKLIMIISNDVLKHHKIICVIYVLHRYAPNIAPVCLPPTNQDANQRLYQSGGRYKCITTGWGKQVLQG